MEMEQDLTWGRGGQGGDKELRNEASPLVWSGRGGRLENWRWGESVLPALASWRGLCSGMDLWAQESPILGLIKLESGLLTVKRLETV